MKQQLLEIINALTGDETIELSISNHRTNPSTYHSYKFSPPKRIEGEMLGMKTQERKTSAPVKDSDNEGGTDTINSVKKDISTEKPKATRTRKANAIEPNPAASAKEHPAIGTRHADPKEDDAPIVDYATYQMERAQDMIDGGDFVAAIKILEQACDAERTNKALANALYKAREAKQLAAMNADEPTEIKIPRKQTVAAPTVAEKPTEETF